jgi:hypothetical protein
MIDVKAYKFTKEQYDQIMVEYARIGFDPKYFNIIWKNDLLFLKSYGLMKELVTKDFESTILVFKSVTSSIVTNCERTQENDINWENIWELTKPLPLAKAL